MTIRELIENLEEFEYELGPDIEVETADTDSFGCHYSNNIIGFERCKITSFYGKDYNALILVQGNQTGAANQPDYEED